MSLWLTIFQYSAQSLTMALKLGDTVPNFKARATVVGDMDWHEYINGSWAMLCSHPADFTPVCTTELGTLAAAMPEFEKRGLLLQCRCPTV